MQQSLLIKGWCPVYGRSTSCLVCQYYNSNKKECSKGVRKLFHA